MTAPLIAQLERDRNRAELLEFLRHHQAQVAYHEQQAAEARQMLERIERALAKMDAQAVTHD